MPSPPAVGDIVRSALRHDRIFEAVERGLESAQRDTPCHNLTDLMRTRSTKTLGDLWEHLCVGYLLARHGNEFARVKRLEDMTEDERSSLGLRRADKGIDLVAWYHDGAVAAVQCKYRSDKRRAVSWSQLATFYALAERTGPYRKHVVMTNTRSVRREGRKSSRDWSICRGSFRSAKRPVWEVVAATSTMPEPPAAEATAAPPAESKSPTVPDLQELRARRLAYYAKQNKNKS